MGAQTVRIEKKRKTETDYRLCIICQQNLAIEPTVTNSKLESLETILSLTQERHQYSDTSVTDFVIRTKDLRAQAIYNNNGSYQRSCYKDFSNKFKRDRAKERFEKALNHRNPSLSQSRVGRPSTGPTIPSEETNESSRKLRSNTGLFDKSRCIICQNYGGTLRNVAFKATEKTMLYVAQKHEDDSVLRRLNSISTPDDGMANDVKYHLRCWVLMKRHVQQKDKSIQAQEIADAPYVIADIEIINSLKAELRDPSHKAINTNQVEKTYRQLLQENSVKDELKKSYISFAYAVSGGLKDMCLFSI